MKKKSDKWERELLGWDDGDVYVYREGRGNFSIKRHPDLHHKLADLAIQYFDEHEVRSEEELRRTMPQKRKRSSSISYELKVCNPYEPDRCNTFKMPVDGLATYSVLPASELKKLGVKPRIKTLFTLQNSGTVKRGLGACLFELQGKAGLAPVVFGQHEDGNILSITTLAYLGLELNPKTFKLKKSKIRL